MNDLKKLEDLFVRAFGHADKDKILQAAVHNYIYDLTPPSERGQLNIDLRYIVGPYNDCKNQAESLLARIAILKDVYSSNCRNSEEYYTLMKIHEDVSFLLDKVYTHADTPYSILAQIGSSIAALDIIEKNLGQYANGNKGAMLLENQDTGERTYELSVIDANNVSRRIGKELAYSEGEAITKYIGNLSYVALKNFTIVDDSLFFNGSKVYAKVVDR